MEISGKSHPKAEQNVVQEIERIERANALEAGVTKEDDDEAYAVNGQRFALAMLVDVAAHGGRGDRNQDSIDKLQPQHMLQVDVVHEDEGKGGEYREYLPAAAFKKDQEIVERILLPNDKPGAGRALRMTGEAKTEDRCGQDADPGGSEIDVIGKLLE